MSKDLFNQIFTAVDESPDIVPTSILAAVKTKDPNLNAELNKNYDRTNIFKVMNSSIFHEGGLRGKSLSGETSTFKVYSIRDLSYFILKASILIGRPDHEESLQDSISMFDDVIEKIEGLQYVAHFYRSWVNAKKLGRIKQELTNIKSNILSKPNPNKLHFRIVKFFKMPDRIDNLIQLFKEQVPEAPPFTIGRAIHKLLSQFGIPSTEPAITQRIYRKNK